MLEITTLVGIIGAMIVLIAFIMNQLGKWSRESFAYDFTNATGSVLLVIYALLISSWPFVILNLIWASFSFWGIWESKFKSNGE